jgi:3-(methylsulfanyl)propanoyl-CoA dehydrogenase
MPVYKAPVDEVLFLLNDVFHIERYANLPGFADAAPDLIEAILGGAAKLCEDVLLPLNRIGDTEGCRRHDDGSVSTPAGFKAARDCRARSPRPSTSSSALPTWRSPCIRGSPRARSRH